MNKFESQFEDTQQLLNYGNYKQLIKRIIDWTLDTQCVDCYRKTAAFLDQLDVFNEFDYQQLTSQFAEILDMLYSVLLDKSQHVEAAPILSVYNLIKSYRKSSFALGPISVELKEGQILGLVGENGNGKTTLLRSLCRELKPTSGTIKYIFPFDDAYDLRSHLIYIPQRTDSWHGSLLSNLQFTASSYGIYGEENELIVQLVIARMGLRKFRTYRWKDLSSGYKMRFELARALLRKPKLLLIDEPLANLDIVAQQVVLDDFRDIARSPFRPMAIVLSSQQLYEVEKASDNVIFLKNGSPRNLFQDTDVTIQEVTKFIIEFESDSPQDKIRETLSALNLEKIQINGGTYVATFPNTVTTEDLLGLVIDNKIGLTYFRNISNSTRRFFLS